MTLGAKKKFGKTKCQRNYSSVADICRKVTAMFRIAMMIGMAPRKSFISNIARNGRQSRHFD